MYVECVSDVLGVSLHICIGCSHLFSSPPLAQGIAPELRRELWKYLLGYHRFGDTDLERMTERMARE